MEKRGLRPDARLGLPPSGWRGLGLTVRSLSETPRPPMRTCRRPLQQWQQQQQRKPDSCGNVANGLYDMLF